MNQEILPEGLRASSDAESHGIARSPDGSEKWDISLRAFFRRGAVIETIISWCGFALLVDPLFLYIPLINEDKKCFTFDPKLKIIALVLRSFVDLPLALSNIFVLLLLSICGWLWLSTTVFGISYSKRIDDNGPLVREGLAAMTRVAVALTLVTFPIPQIAILVFFPQMRGSEYFIGTKVLNSFILLEYVLRASPIYTLCKNFNKAKIEDNRVGSREKRWLPCLVNFALYLLSSHAIGALWYFFSIQREIDCWISACQKEPGCEFTTFHCDSIDRSTFKNITRVNELCPINPPDATIFDFGIFLGPVQSGVVASAVSLKKLLQCFSWGLRNLSSFASNLNTSNNTWEILFVILVSISGLLLFIYLLGHLQTFMQAGTRTHLILQKTQVLVQDIQNILLFEYGLDQDYAHDVRIHKSIEKRLENGEDLDVDNIFSILPSDLQKQLKVLFLDKLKEVVHADPKVLTAIVEHLEPASYAGDTYIIREGEPLDKMIFVTRGTLLTYNTIIADAGKSQSTNIKRLANGDFYGEGLIAWASSSDPFSKLPISAKTVKSHEKVEVFAIKAAAFQKNESQTFQQRTLPTN